MNLLLLLVMLTMQMISAAAADHDDHDDNDDDGGKVKLMMKLEIIAYFQVRYQLTLPWNVS